MSQKGTALITGASAGIGETFASKLAERGYNLILVARRRDRLEKLAGELSDKHKIETEILTADLSIHEDINKVAARIRNCDDLTILINNAGFGTMGDFADVPLNDSLNMTRVHVEAVVYLSHAALAGMIKRKSGSIINVSSVSGFFSGAGCVIYCATKAYVNTFSKSLQKEVAKHNIRIQALCPGFTYTEFHDNPKLEGFERTMVPKWMWFSSDYVVEQSLKCLAKNKVICITGFRYKLLTEILTNRLIGPIVQKFMKRI